MKKRVFAILLIVALVFSSVAVLVSCNKTTEYTIAFRRLGKKVFELTTSDGKITRTQVQEKQEANIKKIDNRQDEGYFFTGWYETVETVEGEYIYSDAINYNRKYTEDVDYEAGYEYAPLEGEEEGYTILGIINGVTNWGENGNGNATPESWKMTQDAESTWLYSITTDIAGRDEIKVKTYDVKWDDGEINIGFTKLGEITFADGVEHPADVEGKGGANDGGSYFYGNSSNEMCNIFVSAHIESANVTITFNYRTKLISVKFNDLVWLDEIPPAEYILVGAHKLDGDTGTGDSPEWSEKTENAARIFSEVADDENLRTLYFEFNENDAFKVKENCTGWAYEIGAGAITEVTFEDGVTEVTGLFGSSGGNISVKYECKVTITLNIMDRTLSVHVTYVNTVRTPLTYIIAGSFPGNSWNVATALTGYTFEAVPGETGKYSLTIDLTQPISWKISAIPGGWGACELGMGAIRSFTKADTVADDVTLATTFKGDSSDVKGNLLTWRDCNVTITVDELADKIDIHVNSAKAHKDLDERWIIAGSMNGWPDGTYSGSDTYVFTETSDSNILELTVDMTVGQSFKIKQVYTWDTQKNWSHLTITGVDTDAFTGSGTGDISVAKSCNVTFTLNLSTGSVTANVNKLN